VRVRVAQLSQRPLQDQLHLVQVIVESDLLVQKLSHGVHEGDPASEVLVVDVSDLVRDGGSSALCKLGQQLSGYFVA
jgi:hypothetical protein